MKQPAALSCRGHFVLAMGLVATPEVEPKGDAVRIRFYPVK